MYKIAKKFWEKQKSYPKYGTIKERRLHELNYIIPWVRHDNTLLDLGCGDGALINCLLELTDIEKFYAYDIAKGLMKNSRVETKVYDCYSDEPLPEVDTTICAGVIPFIFEDEVFEKLLDRMNTRKLLLRAPCTLKEEDEYVNTFSDKLGEEYSSLYRTVDNVERMLSKHFKVKKIDRVYPDEIESEFGTKQYYFVCYR